MKTLSPQPEFAFHRGSLALDFVGTVAFRGSGAPQERLPDATSLARWLAAAGLVAGPATLRVSASVFDGALVLREAIARAASALMDGAQPSARDVATINAGAAGVALGVPQLGRDLSARWKSASPVEFALGRVAADAVTVLGAERARLTRCALDDCGALLLSRARNEPRRWCSMETCGNRAKVAAFRARKAGQA